MIHLYDCYLLEMNLNDSGHSGSKQRHRLNKCKTHALKQTLCLVLWTPIKLSRLCLVSRMYNPKQIDKMTFSRPEMGHGEDYVIPLLASLKKNYFFGVEDFPNRYSCYEPKHKSP